MTLAVLTRPFPRQALLGASRGDLPRDGEQPQRIGGIPAAAPFAPSSVEPNYLQANPIGVGVRVGVRVSRLTSGQIAIIYKGLG